MMDWFADPIRLAYMQRALAAATMVGVLAGFFGVFVVQRGLGFFGSGLAHAAFGGIALGLVVSVHPLVVALPFTMLAAAGMVWMRDRSGLRADTIIGIWSSLAMALGMMLMAHQRDVRIDPMVYLFGSLLAVGNIDLIAIGCVVAIVLTLAPLWPRWAYIAYDAELARTDGVSVFLHDLLYSMSLAGLVVVACKVAGILLISAMLVLPAATARLVSTRFASMTLMSVAIGGLLSALSLWPAYHLDLPLGPAIVATQGVAFLIAVGVNRLTSRLGN